MLWVLSDLSLSALWVLTDCWLILTDCFKIWARMMKIDCSRQTWTGRTFEDCDSLSSCRSQKRSWNLCFIIKLRSRSRSSPFLVHPSSCQDDPLSSQTPTSDFVDRGHLDRENDILGRQVLNKSWSCYENRCLEHPSSCQDDPLSSQILFHKSDNTKQTNDKTSHSNFIEEPDI